MNATPLAPMTRQTFGKWLATFPVEDRFMETHFDGQTIDVPRRMWLARDHFDSLAKLQTWARERWPTWYTRRGADQFGKNTGPTGKQIMGELWADYLSWSERES